MIDVSVIVVNFNTFDYTKDCINSIFKFTKRCSFEVILVDNNSSEIVPMEFEELFPNIKVIHLSENFGFSKANNFGIGFANGNTILLLNSDTELLNDAISICFDRIKNDKKIGVVGPYLVNTDGSFQVSSKCFPTIWKEIVIILKLYRVFPLYNYNVEFGRIQPVHEFSTDYVIGAFFMFRKDDLSHFSDNKLHEDFFMYIEDIQWCYYFKNNLRKTIVFLPQAKVLHHGSASSSIEFNNSKFYNIILPNIYHLVFLTKGSVYLSLYKALVRIRFYLSGF
ncbi:glycosyltransferase family 2 protein [Algoriphagus sp. C2-6-M1]|uniref:glycosyltransferase family 2 protein n=1 Tax=Algoriphagus persicinus TaxID=3108754 RepID=UPI002B3F4A4B|nr:glycosyltransferase family 2 protein [Algoriphagus sp. C2-6-M1]MEB2782430.1 glycosyltransferase family 2 protein [Algoriphagus sp. C2-6-M1]